MWHNPLMKRYRASHLRFGSVIVYLCVYAVVVALAAMSSGAVIPRYEPNPLPRFLATFFFYLVGIQVFLLWGWGTHNCAQVIQQEYDRKSHDFFRLLPLSAREKALGILIGRNQPVLMLVAINTVLMLLVTPNHAMHSQIQCIIWTVAAALGSLSLLSSCMPQANRQRKRTGIIGLVILASLLIPWFIGLCTWMSDSIDESNALSRPIAFGAWHIPFFSAVMLVALNLAAWFYTAILRCFTREDLPLISRVGALGFTANLLALALLFFVPSLGRAGADRWPLFGGILVMGLAVSALVLRGSLLLDEHYLEACRRAGDSTPRHASIRMARLSNLGTAAMLLIIQLGAILTVALPGETIPLDETLNAILGLVVSFIFLAALCELYALNKSTSQHGLLITTTAALLYVLLPLILSGLIGAEMGRLSGINYLAVCLANPGGFDVDTATLLGVHTLLFAGLGIAISRRYRHLAQTAASIQ